MTQVLFNIHTSAPQGVFKPMAQAGPLDVKLSDSPANQQHTFDHINTDSAETYVVVQGDYSLRLGPKGSPQRLYAKTGDVFVIPRATPHGDSATQNGFRILLMETPPQPSWLDKIWGLFKPAS